MAASLVIFFYFFLRIPLWNGLARMLFSVWIMAQLALVAVAIIDPRLASTFARVSFVVIGAVGGAATLFLAIRGQDRALSLIPTWLLFLVWIFGAGLTLTGRLSGDMVVSGLVAGLVLIVLLIGFTVTQFAFRSLEPLFGAAPSELQARSIAVDAAGAAVWEWSGRRDEVKVSPAVETSLGLNTGELCTRVDEFVQHLHSADRERFRLMLLSIQERGDGKVRSDFRIRHADNSYRWFELDAAAIPSSDGRSMKCAGLLRDVTDTKRAQERLLHDAIHCSLTGLPNRELFLDRLNAAIMRARTEPNIRPTLFFIDLDKFRGVNNSFGLVVGDSLLLTVARRLQRHLGPQDSLARVGGDQFAILIPAEQSATDLAALAERVRRSLRSPIKIAGQEVVLTGSLGIAVYAGSEQSHADFLKEAEIAMYRSKRSGADRIEIFRPEMRGDTIDQSNVEGELRKAVEKNQLKFFYKPIVYLPTEELVGFEAVVRWEHPSQGLVNPAKLVSANSEGDLVVKLGSQVLLRAARDCAAWQQELPRADSPLFVSVNISSPQLFRQDLIQEMRHILGRNLVPKGSMRLEVAEHIVLENPERAAEILEWLRGAGAELALDEFGSGYSSFSYLHRFPFDTVKIGRAALRGGRSATDGGQAIVRSMVVLAHEMGKKVVADGIETVEEVGFLRSIGCEFAQGHYFGEPIADKDVALLLRLVRKSERKLQPRGFFRTTAKKRREDQGADAFAADAATETVAQLRSPQAQPVADAVSPSTTMVSNGKAAATPGATTKTMRSRSRQQPPANANGSRAAEQSPPPGPPYANYAGPGPAQIIAMQPTPLVPHGREQPPMMPPSLDALTAVPQPAMPRQGQPPPPPPPMMPPFAGPPPTLPMPSAHRLPNGHSMPPPMAPMPPAPAFHSPPLPGAMPMPTLSAPPQSSAPTPPIPAALELASATNGYNRPAYAANGNGGGLPPGPPPVPPPPVPDFSTLPPSIAQSLARLAGGSAARTQTAARPQAVKKASGDRD